MTEAEAIRVQLDDLWRDYDIIRADAKYKPVITETRKGIERLSSRLAVALAGELEYYRV